MAVVATLKGKSLSWDLDLDLEGSGLLQISEEMAWLGTWDRGSPALEVVRALT